MESSGATREMSFFVPFLFNNIYEFKEYYENPLKLVNFPKSISNEWKLKELYAGYIGSLSGLGLLSEADSFEEFSEKFKTNAFSTMENYFNVEFEL